MRLTSLIAASALAVAAALPLAAPVSAEPYVIDKSHAVVTFRVSHLGFADTHGVFREFDAEIDFDPDAIEEASVAFTIDAGSVDTFWEARDKHVRSADFLDVENHPEITFVSKEVRLISANEAELVGEVTMKGVTNEEVFTVVLNKMGPSPFNKDLTIAGFTVTGEIDRTDYGITYAAPAVGAVMPIRIDIEASPKSQKGS
ncbi:MAG: YceI family protein [Pseudomonadota bacterium]